MNENNANFDYKVNIPVFEGPLELLLHLIKVNEVEITDIPISKITKQYLEYVELMENFNFEIAGDFLIMAATLMRIKARMLIPDLNSGNDDDEDWEDPRTELVNKLLDYKKFKELSIHLNEKLKKSSDIYSRNFVVADNEDKKGEVNVVDTDMIALLNAYKSVITRLNRRIPDEIEAEEFTVEEKNNLILNKLEYVKFIRFSDLFMRSKTKKEAVVTFMSILELIKLGEIKVQQDELFKEIYIYKRDIEQE
jgi:segregation and condensation protein A